MSCNVAVLQPHSCRNMGGLGSSPFARHYWGNHCLFSFPAGTKMFQFPALAFIIDEWCPFRTPGCPIRKSADQWSFAPTRSLSQLITSFIASESQGIRHAPLLTFRSTQSYDRYILSAFTTFTLLVSTCHRSFSFSTGRVRIPDLNRTASLSFNFCFSIYLSNNSAGTRDSCERFITEPLLSEVSPERRCSSRTFRYGYLVTT